jgi:hypothetical protein
MPWTNRTRNPKLCNYYERNYTQTLDPWNSAILATFDGRRRMDAREPSV